MQDQRAAQCSEDRIQAIDQRGKVGVGIFLSQRLTGIRGTYGNDAAEEDGVAASSRDCTVQSSRNSAATEDSTAATQKDRAVARRGGAELAA